MAAGERIRALAPQAWSLALPTLQKVISTEVQRRLGLPQASGLRHTLPSFDTGGGANPPHCQVSVLGRYLDTEPVSIQLFGDQTHSARPYEGVENDARQRRCSQPQGMRSPTSRTVCQRSLEAHHLPVLRLRRLDD